MEKNFATISDFKTELMSNSQLQDAFKANPIDAVSKINDSSPLGTDVWIYRIVVACLGLTILSIIIGVIVLIASDKITGDKNVPTILTAIGSAAIGALAGLLAPFPSTKK